MEKAKEILDRLKEHRTFREANVTIDDVKDALEKVINKEEIGDSVEVKKLQSKVDRLTESNKQLMAENKKLKAGK